MIIVIICIRRIEIIIFLFVDFINDMSLIFIIIQSFVVLILIFERRLT